MVSNAIDQKELITCIKLAKMVAFCLTLSNDRKVKQQQISSEELMFGFAIFGPQEFFYFEMQN